MRTVHGQHSLCGTFWHNNNNNNLYDDGIVTPFCHIGTLGVSVHLYNTLYVYICWSKCTANDEFNVSCTRSYPYQCTIYICLSYRYFLFIGTSIHKLSTMFANNQQHEIALGTCTDSFPFVTIAPVCCAVLHESHEHTTTVLTVCLF